METEKNELSFKETIKDIISEEEYLKTKDIKLLIPEIMKEFDPIIAKYVKRHFKEIGNFIVKNSEEISDNDKNEVKDA